MKRLFIFNLSFRGEYTFPPEVKFAPSIAWLCHSCGEIFARLPVHLDNGQIAIWEVRHGCCLSCKPVGIVSDKYPGSIWIDYDPIDLWNKQLPREVLRRELLIMINEFEKEEENGSL